MRIGVLDLGTNTFNLLIAESDPFMVLFNNRLLVKLGKDGIQKKMITPEAIGRAYQALNIHSESIKKYHIEKLIAYGTSALRDAANSNEITSIVKSLFNIDLNIIDGDVEARLIYSGVKQAVKLDERKVLILDIGGGSCECIIADCNTIFWKKSFDMGMARLLEILKPNDPMRPDEIKNYIRIINEEMNELFQQAQIHKPSHLIGSAGSFESFDAIIHNKDFIEIDKSFSSLQEIKISDFIILYQHLIKSTLQERLNMKGLVPFRAEMIVLAAMLVKQIIFRMDINKMTHSYYSLKEGVFFDFIRDNK